MITRTVKIFGQGFGSTPAEISVTLAGNVIYTGPVPTLDQPVYALPNLEFTSQIPEICNFEIAMDFSGTIPMTCTVLAGTVIFAQIQANYFLTGVSFTKPASGSGPNGFHPINRTGDARSNVFIDNVAQAVNNTELPGTWWYKLSSGSVLSYDLNVKPGTANS
jgi:hypothetical protein